MRRAHKTLCSRIIFSQPFCKDARQRIGAAKWIHSHVKQPGDGLGTKLVCSIENTMWPVRDASTPINTVSLSRDSQTLMM